MEMGGDGLSSGTDLGLERTELRSKEMSSSLLEGRLLEVSVDLVTL